MKSFFKSIAAVVLGILAGVILTVGTDVVLHVTGVFPPWDQAPRDALLLLATAYRIPFNILGSYVVAKLAPNRPMRHALASGVVGVIACTAGAISAWNQGLGSHWYPVALIVLAMPCAWLGGKLHEMSWRASPQIKTAH